MTIHHLALLLIMSRPEGAKSIQSFAMLNKCEQLLHGRRLWRILSLSQHILPVHQKGCQAHGEPAPDAPLCPGCSVSSGPFHSAPDFGIL